MLTIYGLLKSHSIADLIPLIAREVPIKKFTAQQEATKIMYNVWHCVYNVNQLQAVAFINAYGKTIYVKSDKINERLGGLTFFWFRCEIDIVDIDPFIIQKIVTFSSASTFPNTRTMSPPGFSRPSGMPANTSKRPRGVRVVWMTFSKARQLLEVVSVLIFSMLILIWNISTRKPVKTIARMMKVARSRQPQLAQANLG